MPETGPLTPSEQMIVAAIIAGHHVVHARGSGARRLYAEAVRQIEATTGQKVHVINRDGQRIGTALRRNT